MIATILLFLLVLIAINWISGYLKMNLSARYEAEESTSYLSAHGLKLVKVVRRTEKLQKQSEVLVDSRSFFRKIYSVRSLCLLITYSEYEKKKIILWVELVKSWNRWSSKQRSLNYFKETNPKIIGLLEKDIGQ